jgi:subtilisin-like proprotein convertase family protein
MIRRHPIRALSLALVVAGLALVGGSGHAAPNQVFPGTLFSFNDCCNNTNAATGTPSTATNYPSNINVGSGTTVGHIQVTVTLDAIWPDDIKLLLVNPTNTIKVLLMANAGGDNGNGIGPDTLVFDDAGVPIPDNAQLKDGFYAPTALSDVNDCDNQATPAPTTTSFPGAAPAAPYATTLSSFNGSSTQGIWKLYAVDDCNLGNLGGGVQAWSINILGPTLTSVTLRSFTASRSAHGVQLRWRTAAETDTLGYNVYRFAHGTKVKVNGKLIRAKQSGAARGARYALLDRRASKGAAYYRLQAVSLRGVRSWVSTVTVRARR